MPSRTVSATPMRWSVALLQKDAHAFWTAALPVVVLLVVAAEAGVLLAGRPGTDHLFLSDRRGTRHIYCSGEPLTYFRRLVADIRDRSHTAMPPQHAFTVSRLALDAQAKAQWIRAEGPS